MHPKCTHINVNGISEKMQGSFDGASGGGGKMMKSSTMEGRGLDLDRTSVVTSVASLVIFSHVAVYTSFLS